LGNDQFTISHYHWPTASKQESDVSISYLEADAAIRERKRHALKITLRPTCYSHHKQALQKTNADELARMICALQCKGKSIMIIGIAIEGCI